MIQQLGPWSVRVYSNSRWNGWQRGREFILKMCQKRSINHKDVMDPNGGFHPTWHVAQFLRHERRVDGLLLKHSDARYESL